MGCTGRFKVVEIGMALHGLRGCAQSSMEVQALLEALAPKIRECPEPMQPKHLDMAFSGLRNLSDGAGLRSVLVVLAEHLADARDNLYDRTLVSICSVLEAVPDASAV